LHISYLLSYLFNAVVLTQPHFPFNDPTKLASLFSLELPTGRLCGGEFGLRGLKCSRHCHETLFYWLARSGLRFADWAIANTMMILGSYFPWPGLGKIARDGSGYASTVRTA
jgi:hypothetical protein